MSQALFQTWDKPCNLSKFEFLYLQNGNQNASLPRASGRATVETELGHPAQGRAQGWAAFAV